MKVKFNRTVSVDYFSSRLQEWVDKSFDRNEVIEIKHIEVTASKWANLIFDGGDIANDVPRDSFEIC